MGPFEEDNQPSLFLTPLRALIAAESGFEVLGAETDDG